MSQLLTTKAEEFANRASDLPAFNGFSLSRLKTNLHEALGHFGRLGIFEEYTKHDISHIEGMLRLYDWLIPSETTKRMSTADWLLATLGAYLHDFGLLVTREEFENRKTTSTDFEEYKEEFLQTKMNIRDLQDYLRSISTEDRERFFYQEFVRYNHARRIKGWIAGHPDSSLGLDPAVISRLNNLLEPLDSTFRNDLALVCESHHLDDLDDTKKYPVDRPYGNSLEETANVQYAAIILRSADLLHITRDRSPAVAYEIINPINPTSQIEWAKQNAVRRVRPQKGRDSDGNFRDDAPTETIEVFATFKSAEGFFGLTTYLQYAITQIGECYSWAKESNHKFETPHKFPWRKIDSSGVEAQGFIASPFEFQIDQHKILDLLTGHTLYNDTNVALRELAQNSIDAVRLWQAQNPSSNYSPQVHVEWDSEEKVLRVTDNGTGMSQEVIESNFLRVGSSRYQDANFVKHNPTFSAISRFGIGVLSAFMIGDDIEVYTVSTEEDQARHLTLRSVHGKYLIRLLDKSDKEVPHDVREHGTQIILRVRPDADLADVVGTLRQWVVIPQCGFTLSIDNGPAIQIGHDSVREALKTVLLSRKVVTVSEDNPNELLGRAKTPVEIREYEHEGVTLAYAVEWNTWFSQWSFVSVVNSERAPANLGTCVEGIRVTRSTPGFGGAVFYAMANASGKRAPKTNVARTTFEATMELTNYTRTVYRGYVNHVSSEIEEMSSARGLSVTKAAIEASHLCRTLTSQASPHENRADLDRAILMMEVLKSVRAHIVEYGETRKSISFDELSTLDYVYTEESSLSRHLEYVLSAVPRSMSKATIMSAVTNTDATSLSPLYCSGNNWDSFSDMFIANFQPSTIEISQADKRIVATWERVKSNPLWFIDGLARTSNPAHRQRTTGLYIQISPDVQLLGAADYEGVLLKGRTYMFASSLLVEFSRAHTSSIDAANEFAMQLLRISPERHNPEGRRKLELDIDRWRQHLNRMANLDNVTKKELVDILTNWDANLFDLTRWERTFWADF